MISSIHTLYSGRKRDISIFRSPIPTSVDAHPVKVKFGYPSAFCAGTQKLVQRYMIVFLTALESQSSFKSFGSSFLNKLIGSSWIDLPELRHIFAEANSDVTKFFRTNFDEFRSLPPDERFERAVLADVSASGDSVNFRIQLTTAAGDAVDFILPIPNIK